MYSIKNTNKRTVIQYDVDLTLQQCNLPCSKLKKQRALLSLKINAKFVYVPINSETGSFSPSPLIVPVISSFSTIGIKSLTNSELYGGPIASKTYKK